MIDSRRSILRCHRHIGRVRYTDPALVGKVVEALPVLLYDFQGTRVLLQVGDQPSSEIVGGRFEAVVDPGAVSAVGDETGVLELGKMPGDSALWRVQDGDELAHAQFPFGEKEEDPESRLVGKCLEDMEIVFHGRLRMWVGARP